MGLFLAGFRTTPPEKWIDRTNDWSWLEED